MAELEEPMASVLHHKLAPELAPAQHRTNRFLPGFLSKAVCFLAFAILLATFPSQAPEFVNQTLLTRSWELLHLLLVGIAVSYGLFSRRNADPAADKEAFHRPDDTPRSYVSQLLQVSSVFGNDEEEEEEEARPGAVDSKPQVWSSQYSRAEPAVVLAQGRSTNGGGYVDRPLLLPVRSLRSRIPDEESPDENGRPEHVVGSPKTTPPPPREGLVALPSPNPWRSMSGRMEMREETGATVPPPCSLPLPAMDSDIGSLRSSSFRSSPSSRPSSAAASPRRLSPSPEMRAKTGEDSGKKTTFYKPPPPPPPPPAPPFGHRPHHPSMRSFKDELKGFDPKPRFPVEGYSPGRSVRTARPTTEAALGVTRSRSFFPAAAEAVRPPSPAYEYQNGEEEARKKKNKDVLEEAVAVETEDDSDSDDASELGDLAAPGENEVDKKADEFIAKFREQIRLQRIESIRKSAGQRGPRTTT